jgi:hypothetical protein
MLSSVADLINIFLIYDFTRNINLSTSYNLISLGVFYGLYIAYNFLPWFNLLAIATFAGNVNQWI